MLFNTPHFRVLNANTSSAPISIYTGKFLIQNREYGFNWTYESIDNIMGYGISVWDPQGVVLQEELESVQKCAARFVAGNHNYETGSMTVLLDNTTGISREKKERQ